MARPTADQINKLVNMELWECKTISINDVGVEDISRVPGDWFYSSHFQ